MRREAVERLRSEAMMTMRKTLWLAVVLAGGCKNKESAPASQMSEIRTAEVTRNAAPASPAMAMPARAEAKEEKADRGKARISQGDGLFATDEDAPRGGEGGAGASKKEPEAATRAWFPETFLFEPRVVTDAQGAAQVSVRVPDRLTTWRVLALAHTRTGEQAGAVTSFQGTLPLYVDPIVPPFLMQGDEVQLPVQLVNTTAEARAATLSLAARNATLVGAGGPRRVPAQGSLVELRTLVADRAGPVQVRASFAGGGAGDVLDDVVRTLEVRPTGRPVQQRRSGTLAAPRAFETAGTPGADRATDRVRLRVFPGALALLRAELAVSTSRVGLADDAYALLLAGRAADLLAKLGDKPDPEALHALAVLAGQRAVRDARTLNIESASLLAAAALAHASGANPVLSRLGERAVGYLAQQQRPDGTFGGETGWTLQRVLATTAEATRAATSPLGVASATVAARQAALQVQAKASGAFARTAEQVTDGYTAAAIIASGAAGPLADTLRARVRKAIKRTDDGAAYLAVEPGAVRPDGAVPDRIEATALAVLALPGDPALADLGTTLLGAYSVERGWGDGRTNLVAMQAALALFKDPLPASVAIELSVDGAPVAHGVLDGAKRRDVLTLDAALPAGLGLATGHRWTLTATPAVPGLGFSLALDSWVPWEKQAVQSGLELAVPSQVEGRVGQPVDIAVTAVAPAGLPLHIQQALPAGVQVDTASLEARVAAGTIERFVASDGALDLWAPALSPGKTFAIGYRLIPTLGGTLHTSASRLEAGGHAFIVPPAAWRVK